MTKKIQVLVDGHLFDGLFQGARTFLSGLCAELSESRRLDIHIAAHDLDNLEREFADISGSLKFIKLNSESKVRRLLIDFPLMIGNYKFDYAYYQYIDPPIKRCKTIITIHDVLFLEFVNEFSWLYRQKKHLFNLAGSRADILTTVSQYSRRAIHEYLKIPIADIHVVRPALKMNFLEPPSKAAVQESKTRVWKELQLNKYILYVSRIEPRKNHEFLLRAYLDLKLWKEGYHLVFVGKTSIESPKVKALCTSMDRDARRFFHHYESVSQEMLLDLFRAAFLSVYPTRAEGFGYPPLEAAALEVETLTSDATCLSEFEFFGDRFFNPGDLEGLKNKMSALISGTYGGPKMADIAETIRGNFGWENTAERMEELICDDYDGG